MGIGYTPYADEITLIKNTYATVGLNDRMQSHGCF